MSASFSLYSLSILSLYLICVSVRTSSLSIFYLISDHSFSRHDGSLNGPTPVGSHTTTDAASLTGNITCGSHVTWITCHGGVTLNHRPLILPQYSISLIPDPPPPYHTACPARRDCFFVSAAPARPPDSGNSGRPGRKSLRWSSGVTRVSGRSSSSGSRSAG